MKRTVTILVALLLLASVCGCQGDSNSGNSDGGTDAIKTDGDYVMPDIDMEGKTVSILNVDQFFGMFIDFVVEEDSTDEPLNAAVYESNMRLQQQFNVKLVEDEFPQTDWDTTYVDMAEHFYRNVQSGEDVYDILHFPVNTRIELITNGYIMDLADLDALQLDQPWWDATINNIVNVNGHQYMVCGSANLMPYEAMTTVFFNKKILNDNNLDNPYDMVRDGTWTLSAMVELGKEALNLNSDAQWGVMEGGTSVYGFAKHAQYPVHFLTGAGLQLTVEKDGGYEFEPESDDFYLAVESLKILFGDAAWGGISGFDTTSGPTNYISNFAQNRALFVASELKDGVVMRDSEVDFGILPAPKLREEQEKYYTDSLERLHYICIPTLSENPEEVAAILDAMAYDRYKNVVPVYYDSYITYKGLRDEDSLEMLEIMKAGRTIDVAVAYGWYDDFLIDLNWFIGNESLSSKIAARESAINETIDTFVSEYLS